MSVRCPACSAEREVSEEESVDSSVCPACGHAAAGPVAPKPAARAPFMSMNDSLLPQATLRNATKDLFSLNGESRPPMISIQGESLSPGPGDESVDSSAPRASQASVMFSLDELKKAVPEPEKVDNSSDQQLWAMQAVTPLFGTADDTALLTAPLAPPPGSVEAVSLAQRESASARRSLALWIGGSGLGAALLLGGLWVVVDPIAAEEDTLSASTAPTELAAQASPVPQPAVRRELTTGSAALPKPTAPAAVRVEPESASPPVTSVEGVKAPKREEIKAPASKPSKKRRFKAKKRKKPKRKAAVVASKFDKSKAKSALRKAASKSASCGKKGRAGGKGKIRLTFGTNGRVKSARIVSARFAGTSTGKCALRHFRGARIPAFQGRSVTVAKSFTVR